MINYHSFALHIFRTLQRKERRIDECDYESYTNTTDLEVVGKRDSIPSIGSLLSLSDSEVTETSIIRSGLDRWKYEKCLYKFFI